MSPQVFAAKLVNVFTGIVLVFLSLRFILKLFGANTSNDFVGWVYDNTSILLDPFRGIFQNEVVGRQYVFEFNTLFAMLIYALFGMLLLMLIAMLTPDRNGVKRGKK
ncbi:MAG TPA: hypothetical protein VFX86_00040 [Candidatus Saccharimonadales bacterium]|nr:hypothetical protein [Candidatus Saccharimonadales bacterium]